MSSNLTQYIELLDSFVTGGTSATEFESAYLSLFKSDASEWSEAEFSILDELFSDVDAFCADPKLRNESDLDENELRKKCEIALTKLRLMR